MEGLPQELFDLFGINLTQVLMVSGTILLLVEAIKTKFAGALNGGWVTDVIALLLSAGISYKMLAPNWEGIVVMTIICWLLPAGGHKIIKRFEPEK